MTKFWLIVPSGPLSSAGSTCTTSVNGTFEPLANDAFVQVIGPFVPTVPSLRPRIVGSARTTTRNCAVSPFAYAGFVHVNCGAPPVLGSDGQLQPAGMVIDW